MEDKDIKTGNEEGNKSGGLQKTNSVALPSHTSFFQNSEMFEHVQRVAKMFSDSDLAPKNYKGKVGNCIIALEMANRMGASPIMVMQNLDIIMGNPAWRSKFLIASLNASGKFSPLRYEEDGKDGGRTRAWALDKANNEKVFGAWVSMNMAKAEGWIDKPGSKWKTMPELMLRYRAASFFTNQFAPEISMGLATVDEVQDVPYVEVAAHHEPDWELMTKLLDQKKDRISPESMVNIKRIVDNKEIESYQKVSDYLTELA